MDVTFTVLNVSVFFPQNPWDCLVMLPVSYPGTTADANCILPKLLVVISNQLPAKIYYGCGHIYLKHLYKVKKYNIYSTFI